MWSCGCVCLTVPPTPSLSLRVQRENKEVVERYLETGNRINLNAQFDDIEQTHTEKTKLQSVSLSPSWWNRTTRTEMLHCCHRSLKMDLTSVALGFFFFFKFKEDFAAVFLAVRLWESSC